MVFAVEPLLSDAGFDSPFFYDFNELMEAMDQSFEVFNDLPDG